MPDTLPTIAVFDFDRTLIKGDSLWPFLVYAAGWPRALAALAETLFLFASLYLKDKNDPALADPRGFIKEQLLHRLLAGMETGAFDPAIERLRAWRRWNEPLRQALFEHYAHGRRIVIASGGLDLYLPELLKDLPAHDLICTRMEVNGGAVTGAMPSGNCVRARKAELLEEYLAHNGPFGESWGHGNFPHDVPMLQLLKHRIIVS